MTHVLYANAGLPTNDPRHWIIAPLAFPTRFKGWPAKLEGGRVVTDFEAKAAGSAETCAAYKMAACAMFDAYDAQVEQLSQHLLQIERTAMLRRREAERAAKADYDAAVTAPREAAKQAAQAQWAAVLSILPNP